MAQGAAPRPPVAHWRAKGSPPDTPFPLNFFFLSLIKGSGLQGFLTILPTEAGTYAHWTRQPYWLAHSDFRGQPTYLSQPTHLSKSMSKTESR